MALYITKPYEVQSRSNMAIGTRKRSERYVFKVYGEQKKVPGVVKTSGTPKYGGDLLSQLVCQYHRRARA